MPLDRGGALGSCKSNISIPPWARIASVAVCGIWFSSGEGGNGVGEKINNIVYRIIRVYTIESFSRVGQQYGRCARSAGSAGSAQRGRQTTKQACSMCMQKHLESSVSVVWCGGWIQFFVACGGGGGVFPSEGTRGAPALLLCSTRLLVIVFFVKVSFGGYSTALWCCKPSSCL